MSDKKKKRIRIIITGVCVFFIFAGIAVISYPFMMRMYVKNKQDNMIEDIEKRMEENAKKREQDIDSGESSNDEKDTGSDSVVDEKEITRQFDDLELTQNDEDDYSATTEDILEDQNVIGIIEAEAIGIKFAIVEGAGRWNIAYAIGHMTGTAGIGEEGNCVLAGHRGGVYGEFFKHIDKLANGDKISLKNIYGDEFIYTVYDQFVVEPEEMWITKPVDEHDKVLTMLSCENSGKQRLIVRAYLN